MTRLGVDVEVIVPETRFTTSTLTYPFRVTPIYLTSKLQTLKALEYSYKVYKYISENRRKFDAIHGSQWSTYVLVKYRDNIGIPIVTKFHGTTWIGTLVQIWLSKKMTYYKNLVKLPISFLYSSIEKTIAKNSMGLIFISKFVKKEVEYITQGNINTSTIVIYNGVDSDKFKPMEINLSNIKHRYGLCVEDKIILFVGRLDPLKGVDELIFACKKLVSRYPNIKVLIVGDGESSYKEYLQGIAKPRSNFIFTGRVGYDKLVEIYNISDIVVAPSPYASGNEVLEAMACGKPVIVVKGSGFAELINNLKTGFIISYKNIRKELENLLDSIIFDENLLKNIGKNARKFVKTNLTWGNVAVKTINFISSLYEKY